MVKQKESAGLLSSYSETRLWTAYERIRMDSAHTFCYSVGRSPYYSQWERLTLPVQMNCPDSVSRNKLNAFCMYAARCSNANIVILFFSYVFLCFFSKRRTYCKFSKMKYICIRIRKSWADNFTSLFTQQPGEGPPVRDYYALTIGRVSGEVHW